MQPQDAAVIADAFRKEFGQGIELKGITSSSPVTKKEALDLSLSTAIDSLRNSSAGKLFQAAQLPVYVDKGPKKNMRQLFYLLEKPRTAGTDLLCKGQKIMDGARKPSL